MTPEVQDGGRGIRDQIDRYRTAFLAIVTMIVIAAVSAGYILAHERLSVPTWVPIIGHETFTLKGEFQTAQAVAPGQGQSVTIAGAKIGEIASVELRNGRAVVSMHITPKYARYIYRDATMLLRPKTQLKDETVEVSPGHPATGRVTEGYTIPVSQTAPDVNLDELLASLDSETRAYLQELLAGLGEGLKGNSANLSATFKRFDPLSRDLQEIGREVASRQSDVSSSIHNFGLLMKALGNKDTQLAELIDSSNAVFATFAKEDHQVQETLSELPGVLQQTNKGLGKLANAAHVLGPALKRLEPFATSLAPGQRAARSFFHKTTPIFKQQIRPFLHQVLPVIDELQPSLKDFAQATPELGTSFTVLNEFFNELAYNPGANQGGFLFFLDWANHNLDSVLSQGDANGAMGQALLYFNCNVVLEVLKPVEQVDATARLILGLLNKPSEALCKTTSSSATSTTATKAAGLRGPLTGAAGMSKLSGKVFGRHATALIGSPSAAGGKG
jgi:phospholipid/cholesterol/gamma-HCH transport system substrate-binding protein